MGNPDVKLNTGSVNGETENLPLNIEGLAKIDALLKLTADECSAEVDFEKIKRRVLAMYKKRRKRGRLSNKFALAAAACFMIIGVATVIKELPQKDLAIPDKNNVRETVQASDRQFFSVRQPKQPFATSLPGYTGCVYIGAIENVSDSLDYVSEIFNRKLPDYMVKRFDAENNIVTAKGTDKSGNYKYCKCAVVSAPPYKLELGQLGKIKDELVFFWQVKKEACLRISFAGFDEKEAQNLVKYITDYRP